MSEADKQVEALRGEPAKIKLFGKELTIKRLSIDGQLKVIDLFQTVEDSDTTSVTMLRIVKVVSLACDIEENKLREDSNLAEIMRAFSVIWKQNEFGFLVKQVAEAMPDLQK